MSPLPSVEVAPSGSLLARYREVAGAPAVRALEALARRLRGRRITMVNSTTSGGGVAEILHRMVTLLGELGLPTRWEVMPGDARFHAVTKTIHNALHGAAGATLDEAARETYRAATQAAAESLELAGDLVMIHDPHPAGLAALRRAPGQHWVWRCHIDLSHADRATWEFLRPAVEDHHAAVFSHRAFVPSLQVPSFLVPPSIDPFADKNRPLTADEEQTALAPLGLPSDVPWITQVSRFDRLKDPLGVLDAFALTRRRERAHLVLAGGSADDDPEGAEVLAEVMARAAGRDDVSVLALPPGAHVTINALQRHSTVVLQKSLREGFALTVSEALWKRRAVAASAVGGIPLQVIHDRTGLLVRSVEGTALALTRLLREPELRRRLGHAGREHVRDEFLHVREARDHLALFAWLLERE